MNIWISQYNTYAKLQKYDDSQKIDNLNLFSTGIAALWFINLDPTTKKSWDTIETNFKSNYTDNQYYLVQI